MSSPAYAAPLDLAFEPSRRLIGTLLAVHLGVLALVPALPLPTTFAVPLAMAVLGGLVLALRGVPGLTRHGVTRLVWEADGSWRIYREGAMETGELLYGGYLSPGLVVLPLRTARGRQFLPILPDAVGADPFRRLRVRLLLTAHDGVTPDR